MWKASAGHNVALQNKSDDDDWETDPDFVNDVTEEEQRWGSKTIVGSGRTAGAIDMAQLRQETEQADATMKKKEIEIKNPGMGYGGKFGIETDRMDKSAMGHDYIAIVEKHGSQKDYSDGFGGKFGVQKDRVDKSAAGWDHKEKVEKHSSQKDYSTGFGGKFGVQNDRVDKSALGWDHVEKVEKHESQKDYSKGFGGKFGVQEDRKDKSALGWDHHEAPQKHESQLDHKVGFGGKFGVQNDRMDKSAVSFKENPEQIGTNYTKTKPDIGAAKPSNLRAKFENFAKLKEEEDSRRTAEQKRIREEKDKLDREQALKGEEKRNSIGESEPVSATEPIAKPVRKIGIDTGRSGGIGSARDLFNKAQSPEEATVPRREPIKLPKEPVAAVVQQQQPQTPPAPVQVAPAYVPAPAPVPVSVPTPVFVPTPAPIELSPPTTPIEQAPQSVPIQRAPSPVQVQVQTPAPPPDVIPTKLDHPEPEIIATLPPPAAFTNSPSPEPITVISTAVSHQPAPGFEDTTYTQESIYSNVDVINEQNQASNPLATGLTDEQINLAEYIEDTGISAIALYDYEATADDEISFDPNDIISHIEQIDEGWWRGLCKNRFGLFPANYVQLQK